MHTAQVGVLLRDETNIATLISEVDRPRAQRGGRRKASRRPSHASCAATAASHTLALNLRAVGTTERRHLRKQDQIAVLRMRMRDQALPVPREGIGLIVKLADGHFHRQDQLRSVPNLGDRG